MLGVRPGRQPFESLATELLNAQRFEGRATDQRSLTSLSVLEDDARVLAESLRQAPGRLALELRVIAERERASVLLFVDQLEELFTLTSDPELSARFMEAVCAAADDALDPVRIVLSLRDDFLGRLATGARVREALSQVMILQRPAIDALEQTLCKPLEAVGYGCDDPELPREMVAAVSGEQACLPLLQFTAQKLWERRDRSRRLILREAYEQLGGVAGALAQHADGVLEGFSAAETRLARELLLRLVTAERTRRMVDIAEALDGLGGAAKGVLDRLTQARLLTVRKKHGAAKEVATLELAHESLIARWSTLSRWLDEGQEGLAFLAEAGEAAKLWRKRGQRDEELWQGEALSEALRMLERCRREVPARVRRFIEAAQHKDKRGRRQRRLLLAAAMAALGLVVVALALQNSKLVTQKGELAVQKGELGVQKGEAERQRAVALVDGARAALRHGDLLEAHAKLRLAFESADTPAARALWWQLQGEPVVWKKVLGTIVYQVAFAPDGRQVAAACQDSNVYLLDTRTRSVRALRGHADQVFSVAFSADGRLLASGDWGGTVRLWEVVTGKQARVLRGHTAAVSGLSFSPDGRRALSGSRDKTVRLWEVATGKQERVLKGHAGGVNGVSFSPDGRLALSGSVDKTARLWEVATGKQVRVLEGHAAGVYDVSFSPNGRLALSGSGDKTVRLWEVATGKRVRVLEGHAAGVNGASFSPDGRLALSGSLDKTVRVWDVATGKLKRVLEGHTGGVYGVSFSPDGRLALSGGSDKTVRLWEVATGKQERVLQGHAGGVNGVSFSPDGRLALSGGSDKTVRLWEVATGKQERVLEGHAAAVHGVSFSPDGRLALSGGYDKTVRLWEVATGTQKRVLKGHAAGVYDVSFSPDGRLALSGSYDRTVRLWEVATGTQTRVLEGHAAGVVGAIFSPDGRLAASGSFDKTVRLWDVDSGEQKRLLKLPARLLARLPSRRSACGDPVLRRHRPDLVPRVRAHRAPARSRRRGQRAGVQPHR